MIYEQKPWAEQESGFSDCLMGMFSDQPWAASVEDVKWCFSDLTSLGCTTAKFENMIQCPDESVCLYIHRYSKIHYAATNKTAE